MAFLGALASTVLLFCLVFGMSATVEMKSLKKQVQNRVALSIGVLMQFVILPFVGFGVVKILDLPSTAGVILLVITSSPGGSYSNWWCSLFNAELALSVTMTTISTLLSVVMLPTNLVLYTRWTYSEAVVQSLDWTGLVVSLVVVISGISGGLYSSYRAEQRGDKARFHKTANRLGNIAGIMLVSLSVLVSSTGKGGSDEEEEASSSKASLWDQTPKFYIGVALPAIIGLCLAVKLASHYELEKPERVAVAVEACYQNTGIATSVALTLYDGDELSTAIGVPLFYGIVEAVLLACFCMVCWKIGWTKAPPDENCCKVIYNSYEVEEDNGEGEGGTTAGGEGSNQQTPPKHQNDVIVDLGSTDDEEADTEDHAQVDPETEMTPQQQEEGATTTTKVDKDGAVSVVKVEEGAFPKATRWERAMATMRARAAGYGFGQQDEDRGLRTSWGPTTLGLSQVPSPKRSAAKEAARKRRPSNSEGEGTEPAAASPDKTLV